MTPLDERDLKFIAAAKHNHEHRWGWLTSMLPLVIVMALLLGGIAYFLLFHFKSRGVEFFICASSNGKLQPTDIQLRKIFVVFFGAYAMFAMFTLFWAYLAWQVHARAFTIVQKLAGDSPANVPR